jgi:hypothetical protein
MSNFRPDAFSQQDKLYTSSEYFINICIEYMRQDRCLTSGLLPDTSPGAPCDDSELEKKDEK